MTKYRRSWQENLVFVVDICVIALCYIAAFFIRFDGVPSEQYLAIMRTTLPLVIIVRMAGIIYFKVHKSMWQYASVQDITQIIKAITLSSVFVVAGVLALHTGHPRSIFIIDWLLLVIALGGVRFLIRATRPIRWRMMDKQRRRKRILVVGAGDATEMILREILYGHRRNYDVVGIVDDDPKKHGKRIHGIPIIGTTDDMQYIVGQKNVMEIIITIPTLRTEETRVIVEKCIKSGAKYRILPNITDVIQGRVRVGDLREVRLDDLLKRDEVFLSREKIGSYITGKNVLITGAGGSIGAELCRQVARFSPKTLILYERSENALFYIDLELGQLFENIVKIPVVGDICDREKVRSTFAQYNPHIIFHAAAHKHVPLMEINAYEALKNNVFGTQVLAEEAYAGNIEKFIMLSTDKAVDPVNIMGVSKKITEMYITALGKRNNTRFMAVRFGNVLGSQASVVNIFRKQIEKGNPVTVTHPEIKRYFMTIPEAAGLVMEAGYMGKGGEIFILEMGRQVKIVDLARDMIRLSGLEPNKDIDIVYTGLRPGEKMNEDLVAHDELLLKTRHDKIKAVKSEIDAQKIFNGIEDLHHIVEQQESLSALVRKLKELEPGFEPAQKIPPKELPKKETVVAS